jgi:streptogramin lyase
VLVLTLVAGSHAQTSNSKYEVTPFGSPPYPQAKGNDRDTISVAADSKGSILILRRSDPPVLVYNRDGKLQNSWGTGVFVDTHSIDVDRFGFVWITDRNGHMVYKFTLDGKPLLALGTKGVKGDDTSKSAFNRPSDVFVAPNGDIFVGDGYDNHRVVHFTKDGTFIKVIGGIKGVKPGEFEGVHGVQMDTQGRLIVMDRHTQEPRIQVWDPQTGKFVAEWGALGITAGSGLTTDGKDTFFVSDTDGEKILIMKDGKIVETIPGLQVRPHNITLDVETGAIYLADTTTPGGLIKKVVRK